MTMSVTEENVFRKVFHKIKICLNFCQSFKCERKYSEKIYDNPFIELEIKYNKFLVK